MGGLLLINPSAGRDSGAGPEELRDEARARGVEARILAQGEDPSEAARAADADIVGAAGGDGSVAAVAAVAVDRGLPFVCVPFGTRNHFARDLGQTAKTRSERSPPSPVTSGGSTSGAPESGAS